jgi:hypothetical protein
MMARPAEFGNELESARDRAEAVRQLVGESQLQRSSFVLEAVEKVETTLEELPVSPSEGEGKGATFTMNLPFR